MVRERAREPTNLMKVSWLMTITLITDAVGALLHDMDPDVEIHTAASAPEAMKLVEPQPDADLLLLDLGVRSDRNLCSRRSCAGPGP